MNDITMRIELLRGEMMKNDIDYYLILSSDYHDSEYVDGYFKAREYMSGFTGSAGSIVISLTEAALWTDGRYFLQAEKMKFGQTLGYDGRTMTKGFGDLLRDALKSKGARFKTDVDLVNNIWEDRPAFPAAPIWILEEKYSGRSVADKLASLREAYRKAGAKGIVISSLDDIAWLYNFRGNDVKYTPVATLLTKRLSSTFPARR